MEACVAIITRTQNRPLLLERAIRSVLRQTKEDWIHVIVNDGGEAAPVDSLIAQYRNDYKGRVAVLHNSNPAGMEAASNAGIRASESKYILIHDDDDSLDPNFLEETVRYLESTNWPTISAVATWVMRIEEKIVGNDIVEMKRHIFLPLAPCISIDEMARFNPCPPISLLFRRDAYLRVGPFDESLPVLGDWDFGIRLISRFDIGVIQKPLANYHLRPGITGGNLANTLYSIMDKHRFFDPLIRNRYARSEEHLAVGRLIQRHALRHPVDELARLYRHVVIGRIIYLWSKYVNSRIPPHPDNV